MLEKWFIPVSQASHQLPDSPGLYAIRIAKPGNLKASLRKELGNRGHNIMYIGIASQSLKKRLGQELWAKGHGTFFRSLGAVLGYLPPKSSLVGKGNQNNYKFSPKDEGKIIKWIEENLTINWLTLSDNWNIEEDKLIKKYFPMLNIQGNPGALREVVDARNKCKVIARG